MFYCGESRVVRKVAIDYDTQLYIKYVENTFISYKRTCTITKSSCLCWNHAEILVKLMIRRMCNSSCLIALMFSRDPKHSGLQLYVMPQKDIVLFFARRVLLKQKTFHFPWIPLSGNIIESPDSLLGISCWSKPEHKEEGINMASINHTY